MRVRLIIFLVSIFGPVLISCDRQVKPSSSSTFQPLLTESTLDQWNGKPGYWKYEDGVLTGEITPNTILIENTFFVWEGETGDNFELKAEYRISEQGNSGINYKSERIEGSDFILQGYQADLDGANKYTGNIYDEKGRSTLAKRGQIVLISDDGSATIMNDTGAIKPYTPSADSASHSWNEYHIIAHQNTIIQLVNGQVMSILIDESDSKTSGKKLGLQLHLGPPMKVEFRNIRLKKL